MSTFIGQLIGFAVIVFLVWRFVVPLVRRMMTNQKDTVRRQLEEHAEAEKKVADADTEHARALEEAKAEAAAVIEEARHDAERIAEQLRAQADLELERIKIQERNRFNCCASSLYASYGRASVRNRCSGPATSCATSCPTLPSCRRPLTASSPISTKWPRRRRRSQMLPLRNSVLPAVSRCPRWSNGSTESFPVSTPTR